MNSLEDKLFQHVQILSAEIGARPIGSPGNQRAADYIDANFRHSGLEVENQPYPCTAWKHTSTNLERGGIEFQPAANAFSLPCDVSGQVVRAGTPSELEMIAVKGKILLLYGHLVRAPLSPKSWFLLDDRDRRVIGLLESLQPAALCAPPTATDYFGQLTEDAELDLPAVTISSEAALLLEKNPQLPVHLRIDASRSSSTARNIVGRWAGKEAGKIVLMAHFDTKINTAGAMDNAGGVSILLALAETLQVKCSMEFVAFNGEEYLPMGDDEYLRRGEGGFPSILAAINFDEAGAALGSNSITAIGCTSEFKDGIQSVARQFPGVVWVEPLAESNHSTFTFRGVPAVALSSIGTRHLANSPQDNLDQVDVSKLAEACQLVKYIVGDLSVQPSGWGREIG